VSFISEFEEAIVHQCRKEGYDGVVCGHIHHAEIRDLEGTTYMNCGDWVESCTALVEDEQGRFQILDWPDRAGDVVRCRRSRLNRSAVGMKRLLIVTDAWEPQTNGVVTTLQSVIAHLPALGYEVRVIHPGLFATGRCRATGDRRGRDPWRSRDDGPGTRSRTPCTSPPKGRSGLGAGHLLARRGWPFSTSLHTKFPEYATNASARRWRSATRYLRWFHRPATAVLCTTESHREELARWGIATWWCGAAVWTRRASGRCRARPEPRPRCSTSAGSPWRRTSRRSCARHRCGQGRGR
jgi:hypothetical protein